MVRKYIYSLFLSFLLIIPIKGYSQLSDIKELVEKIQEYKTQKGITSVLDDLIRDNEIYLEDSLYRRLGDSYFQKIYTIEIAWEKYYCLNLIWGKEGLVTISLYENRYSDRHEGFCKIRRKVFEKSSRSAKRKYRKSIKNRLGYRPLNLLVPNKTKEMWTVGYYCGRGGMTHITQRMVRLVKRRNQVFLRGWCKSDIPEIRLCGLLGLTLLKAQKIPLSKSSERLIVEVSKEKTLVQICRFCTYRGHETTINEEFEIFDSYVPKLIERINRNKKRK